MCYERQFLVPDDQKSSFEPYHALTAQSNSHVFGQPDTKETSDRANSLAFGCVLKGFLNKTCFGTFVRPAQNKTDLGPFH